LLTRFLPAAPAVVADVGGGPGVYAAWLASRGYHVHLLDPVPLHVEQARALAPLASAAVGDARTLPFADASVDAILELGPLYHLLEAQDRRRALAEARRVLRPGGVLAAAAITRFASTIDGLLKGYMASPEFERIVERLLADGRRVAQLHRELLPLDEVDFGAEGFGARIEPYRSTVPAGGDVELEVAVRRAEPRPLESRVGEAPLAIPARFG
jgi:SAM-dependent methyltransferase